MFTVKLAGSNEVIENYDTMAEAIADMRSLWMEEPETDQCFLVYNVFGIVVAVLLRNDVDPNLCHTLYIDGKKEDHTCHYLDDPESDSIVPLVTPAVMPTSRQQATQEQREQQEAKQAAAGWLYA